MWHWHEPFTFLSLLLLLFLLFLFLGLSSKARSQVQAWGSGGGGDRRRCLIHSLGNLWHGCKNPWGGQKTAKVLSINGLQMYRTHWFRKYGEKRTVTCSWEEHISTRNSNIPNAATWKMLEYLMFDLICFPLPPFSEWSIRIIQTLQSKGQITNLDF